MTACRWTGNDSPRVIRGRHLAGCAAQDAQEGAGRAAGVEVAPGAAGVLEGAQMACSGCQPCQRPHCLVGWTGDRGECQTHAESVCPSCLGKVREHIAEIVRLTGLPLVEQVLAAGSVDTEAADLLGPAANPVQWRQRSNHGHLYDADSRLGWHTHPLSVLGWYDMLVTEHLGHTRTTRITVTRAAAYLDANLTFLAADLEFDFADMAEALADCRAHLERVLHDGEQREEGAPCLKCGKRVIRVTNDDGEVAYRCERCRKDVSEAGYMLAVRAEHIDRAPMLTTDDMAIRTGVPAGTIRRWANARRIDGEEYPPLFRSCARNAQGRKLYRVSDVEQVRDTGGDTRGSSTVDAIAGIVSNEGAA